MNLHGSEILIKSNPRTFELEIKTEVAHWGMGSSQTDLFLAFIKSNEYQNSSLLELDSIAQISVFGSIGDSCLYYQLYLGRKGSYGKTVRFTNKFNVNTYDISTDFSLIDTLFQYDKLKPSYVNFTKSSYPYINTENKTMVNLSMAIWEQSSNVLDYARNCYLFVAQNFDYKNPETGFKTLSYTLKIGGGDCGNLSSVFITLLRIQEIPSRHLMGFRKDGSLHVWADFYLECYGWIPVDVTYKNEYPTEDYFGNIKFDNSGFIVQRGIGQEVNVLHHPARITGLQTYSYQVDYSKEYRAKIYIDRKIKCTEVK